MLCFETRFNGKKTKQKQNVNTGKNIIYNNKNK